MINLWKRFTTWLYYLRHPCTIITMDEAPAKGVGITFSYSGEYEQKVQKDLNIFKKPLEYSAHFEGKMPDPNILADMLKPDESVKTYKAGAFIAEGRAVYLDKDGNVLPALSAKEQEHERELAWSQSVDWPIGDRFEFGKVDTSMMYRFLEEDE